MDLERALFRATSKTRLNAVAAFVLDNPEHFSQLVKLFLQGPYRQTQRAAWALSICAEANPELVKPYIKDWLTMASTQSVSVAVKRNILRLLQFVAIPGKLQGKAVSVCFGLLTSPNETIAVKVFSMTVLSNIAEQQPALARELTSIIEYQLPYASAGFLARARKIMARHKL